MKSDETLDVTNHLVARLSPLTPGSMRAERVRALCRARLEHDRRSSTRFLPERLRDVPCPAALSRFGRHVVAPAIVAGLFVLYAAHVVTITLRTLTRSW